MTHHVFYDTETTGPDPAYDQILQAAGILTDDDFVEIDTVDIRSRLAGHIVPTAGALKVTHVDPYDIDRAPYSAYEFARLFHDLMTDWSSHGETAFAGYNTIRFDEEILRQMFWQSLQDPYLTSGRGKMRTDYLIMMRALHARNPDCIEFPVVEKTGKKSFKLENLAPANGFEGHDAHDALGDVRATIFAARLIRDTDPALFEHMMKMGNANAAKDFVDSEIVFQLLGGPMLNPGVIDACLVASEGTNPKSKTAWNLAVDPTPYLDMRAEDLLAVMRKSGTPFRTVKCNKQPGAFPMNWGFENRVSTESFEPAEPSVIDERVEIIRNHDAFRQATAEALALKTAGYAAPEHLEEKIYAGGFPSWDDKGRMRRFHTQPDWASRLDLVRQMEKPELRSIGMRQVFLNAPEAVSETLRQAIDERLVNDRFTLETDRPWTTVGKLMEELDEMLKAEPEDPELLNIRAWALETYPIASGWEEWKAERARREAAAQADGDAGDDSEDEPEDPAVETAAPAMAPVQSSVSDSAITYLDGLD